MIIIFIIAFGLAITIVFMVGFWAGRLTERSKWKKQQPGEDTAPHAEDLPMVDLLPRVFVLLTVAAMIVFILAEVANE